MSDWSVVGEIIGETNLDEVGESVERSLQNAAEATEKAAAGSEDMEKSMESATEAVASLIGASSEADDQLEEVEAEMEDIVTDAAGATTSISTLQGSLMALNAQDVGIDLHSNIETIEENWRDLRNQIDDQPDIAIPHRASGQPAEDFFGDQTDFGRAMSQLHEAEETMSNIREERDSAVSGDDGTLNPFRQVDPRGSAFRSSLAERLEPGGRFETVNRGRLSSTLSSFGEAAPARDIARAVSGRSDIGTGQMDALRAVTEAADVGEAARPFADIDDTPALPAPGDRATARGPPNAIVRKFVGAKESIQEASQAAENLNEQIEAASPSTEELTEKLQSASQAGNRLDDTITDVQRSLSRSNRQIGNIGDHFDEATSAANNLDDAAPINVQSDREIGGMGPRASRTLDDAGQAVGSFAFGSARDEGLNDRPSFLARQFETLSTSAAETSTTLGFVTSSLATYAGAAKSADEVTEELDDEFEDLSRSLKKAAPALQNVSANLGPFNVSFSNLLVTIPSLIATIGPLIGLLVGVAGAAIAVTGAFAALIAVGALGFTETLKNNFAGIESTGDALKAVFKGLKKAILTAIEPLQNVTLFGGLGAAGVFITVLRDIVQLIHLFALASAEILEMQMVQEFLLKLRAAMLGFGDAGEEGMSMIEGLKSLIRGALPVLESFLLWFIRVLPEFLAFAGRITNDIGPALGMFGSSLIELSAVLTEAGAGMFNVLLPALARIFSILATVIKVLITVERAFGVLSDIIIITGVVAVGLTLAFIKMASVLAGTVLTVQSLIDAKKAFVTIMQKSTTATSAYNSVVAVTNGRLKALGKTLAMLTLRFAAVLIGVVLILDAIGELDSAIALMNSTIIPAVNSLFSFTDAMGSTIGVGETLTNALQATIGIMLIMGGIMPSLITTIGAYTASLIGSALAHYNLAGAQFFNTLAANGLTASINTLNVSLTSLQAVTIAAGAALFLFGAALATGLIELEQIPVVGEDVADVFEELGDLFGVSKDSLEMFAGAIMVAIPLMWRYTASASAAGAATAKLAIALIAIAGIFAGLQIATGNKELEEFGKIGRMTAGALEWLAGVLNMFTLNFEFTKDMLEKGFGIIMSVVSAFTLLTSILAMIPQVSAISFLIGVGKAIASVLASIVSITGAIIAIVAVAAAIFADWALNMQETVNKFERVFDILGNKINETEGMTRFLFILLASLATIFIKPFQELFELILNPSGTLSDWQSWFMSGIDAIKAGIVGIWDMAVSGIHTFIDEAIRSLLVVIEGFMSLLGKGIELLGKGIKAFLNIIPGVGGGLIGGVLGAVTSGLGGLLGGGGGGGGGGLLGGIPMLQKGGFVEEGGLAMLHSNEMVIPASALQNISANAEPGIRTNPATGRRGEAQTGSKVVVNIDNRGSGTIDDRRAREIANITRRAMDNRRRREDGR